MSDSEATPPPAPPRLWRGGRVGAVVAWATLTLVVALWVTTGLGRTWRSPPWMITALVTFLPYLYAAVLAWCFALWALLPDRSVVPMAMGLTALAGAVLWGPSWPARPEVAAGEPLVVMHWNIRRLWGGPGAADPLQCVIDTIAAEAPDVVSFVEASEANLGRIIRATGLSCRHATYVDGGVGQGGIATCARGDRWQLRGQSAIRYLAQDRWRYTLSELERGGRVVNLLSVHLSPYGFRADRLRRAFTEDPQVLLELGRDTRAVGTAQNDQAAALLDRVARLHDPTVVAGDFNSTPDMALHVALRSHLDDTWQRGGAGFGSTFDLLDRFPIRIDYVYATRDFAVRAARVPDAGCSDHRPVVSELVLRTNDR